MSTFTLAISCLTTSNLPWLVDLTFQVSIYCCLQHQTLLLSSITSKTGWWCCIGYIYSFFLELFLHWFPVAYWALTDLGSSSFRVLSFCLFILFMGFSRQEYWSGLPFPSPVDHILSELSTILTKRLEFIKLLITQGEKLSGFRPGDTQTCLNAPGEMLCSSPWGYNNVHTQQWGVTECGPEPPVPPRIIIRTEGREGILTPAQSSLMFPRKRKLESRW